MSTNDFCNAAIIYPTKIGESKKPSQLGNFQGQNTKYFFPRIRYTGENIADEN